MKTLDADLKMLVQRGLVSVADAKAKAKDPNTIIG
jgi:twitching motility protein PilT